MNRALRTALKMWDTVPAAMGERTMEELVPCPMCRGNGYVYDELLAIPAEERASLERDGHITMDYAPGIR